MDEKRKAALFLSAGTVMWGSTFLVAKALFACMSPGVLLAARFVVAAAVLAPFAVASARRAPSGTPHLSRVVMPSILLGLSLLGGYAFQLAGLRQTGPGKSAFITSLYVAIAPFVSWPLCGRRPRLVHFASVGIALAGVWLLADPSGGIGTGDLLTAASAVFWAVEIALIDRLWIPGRSMEITAGMLAVVALGSLPLIPVMGGFTIDPNPGALAGLLFLSVFATSMLMYWQIRWQPSLGGAVSSLIYIGEAVIAAAGGAILLGERLSPAGWIGCALVIASILLAFSRELRCGGAR